MPYAVFLPSVHLEPAFNQNGRTLSQVLTAKFGKPIPCVNIDKYGNIGILTVTTFATFINRQTKTSYFHAARPSRAHVGVARQIAHENHFIERCQWDGFLSDSDSAISGIGSGCA